MTAPVQSYEVLERRGGVEGHTTVRENAAKVYLVPAIFGVNTRVISWRADPFNAGELTPCPLLGMSLNQGGSESRQAGFELGPRLA